jgi:hypothetical protein
VFIKIDKLLKASLLIIDDITLLDLYMAAECDPTPSLFFNINDTSRPRNQSSLLNPRFFLRAWSELIEV